MDTLAGARPNCGKTPGCYCRKIICAYCVRPARICLAVRLVAHVMARRPATKRSKCSGVGKGAEHWGDTIEQPAANLRDASECGANLMALAAGRTLAVGASVA